MEQIQQLIAYPVQLAVAVIIVLLLEFPISTILDSISDHIKIEPPAGIDPDEWEDLIKIPGKHGGRWIGITERLLFFIVLWVSAPILVGAWLAFKVASKWESWSNLTRVPNELDDVVSDLAYFKARTRWSSRTMQRFLVGTGLNLLAAFVGLVRNPFPIRREAANTFIKLCRVNRQSFVLPIHLHDPKISPIWLQFCVRIQNRRAVSRPILR